MKKLLLILLVIAAALAIGCLVWKGVHRKDALCGVTYGSQFGYTLSMAENEGRFTVTYADDNGENRSKEVDSICYTNILDILEVYDFPSWRHLSDRKAPTAGFDTLEIRYKSGRVLFFSGAQELPGRAREVFSVINTCLMEYAGILKAG